MIDRFERFSVAILDISRYWHKIANVEMEKYGLRGPHSIYLATMARFPEGITAMKLCELCGKDKSDVSRMMGIMEKKGLVKKEGIHQNCYKGVYKLTEEGKRAAESVCERASLAVKIASSDLTEEMSESLYKSLDLIIGRLKQMSMEGLPTQEKMKETKEKEMK